MGRRTRNLSVLEEAAIVAAKQLRRQLERLRDESSGNQEDAECIADALDCLDMLHLCLEDLGKSDEPDQ